MAQDGRVEPGDMILEVNGVSFENMSNDGLYVHLTCNTNTDITQRTVQNYGILTNIHVY